MRSSGVGAIVLLLSASPADGAEAKDQPPPCQTELHFQIENDNKLFSLHLPVDSDEFYTNGWRYSQLFCTPSLYWFGWLERRLPLIGRSDDAVLKTGFVLGQAIYTPRDLQVVDVQEFDRPYAGMAHVGARARVSTEAEVVDLELHVAWTGRPALGKEFQDGVHDVMHIRRARGWDTQIGTAVGAQAVGRWQRRWWATPWCVACNPSFRGRVGAYSHIVSTVGSFHGRLGAGATVRAGIGGERILPDEHPLYVFGAPGPGGAVTKPVERTPPWYLRWSLSVFARGEARLVGWNGTLEGPVFAESEHTVESRLMVWDLEVGWSLSIGKWFFLNWGFVWRGAEMEGPGIQGEGTHDFREIQLAVTF